MGRAGNNFCSLRISFANISTSLFQLVKSSNGIEKQRISYETDNSGN